MATQHHMKQQPKILASSLSSSIKILEVVLSKCFPSYMEIAVSTVLRQAGMNTQQQTCRDLRVGRLRRKVIRYLMFSNDKAKTFCAVAHVHWNRKVASKKRRYVYCQPCSTVVHICHHQNARVRGKFESFSKMSVQRLRLHQQLKTCD